jgi:hypothetical protein
MMVNQTMSTKMVDSTCEWVLARLPLWVGDCGDEAESEGGDLSTADHHAIERHLAICPSCCRHRVNLEQVIETLATIAADSPVPGDSPSLWPALVRRIEDRGPRTHSGWLHAAATLRDRWMRLGWAIDGGWAMRRAWVGDSFSEVLGRVGLGQRRALLGRWLWKGRVERQGWGLAMPGTGARLGWILGFGLAAILLVVLMVLPAVHRQTLDAQSTIASNASALPSPVVAVSQTDEEGGGTSQQAVAADIPASELAQAEPVRAPEASTSRPDGTSASKSATAGSPRYGYDLDYGIPMPPDARDAKPVY